MSSVAQGQDDSYHGSSLEERLQTLSPYKIIGVDTQEELEKVREYITNNGITLD